MISEDYEQTYYQRTHKASKKKSPKKKSTKKAKKAKRKRVKKVDPEEVQHIFELGPKVFEMMHRMAEDWANAESKLYREEADTLRDELADAIRNLNNTEKAKTRLETRLEKHLKKMAELVESYQKLKELLERYKDVFGELSEREISEANNERRAIILD